MAPLGGYGALDPVDQTWQSLREAVLGHPRIVGAKFDHNIKRVDFMTERTAVPSQRRMSARVAVNADGTRVVISGAGKRGLTHQVATELLAEVSDRVSAPAPSEDSRATLTAAPAPDELPPPSAVAARATIPPDEDEVHEKPQVVRTQRTPLTPPAPPPPPPSLTPPPKRDTGPTHDALAELAGANDWLA